MSEDDKSNLSPGSTIDGEMTVAGETTFEDRLTVTGKVVVTGAGTLRIIGKKKKPPRGPPPGAVNHFRANDRALFPRMSELIAQGSSVTGAANLLVAEGIVAGLNRKPDSKARRLARLYEKER